MVALLLVSCGGNTLPRSEGDLGRLGTSDTGTPPATVTRPATSATPGARLAPTTRITPAVGTTPAGRTTPATTPTGSSGSAPATSTTACGTAASRLVLTPQDDRRTVHVRRDARIDLRAPGSDSDPEARVEGDAVELVRLADAPGRQYEVRPAHPGTARIVVPDPQAFVVTLIVCA